MMEMVNDITRSAGYRKKARTINRVAMVNTIGEENLPFIAEAVKEVEWSSIREESKEDCDCFGCDISSSCEELEYRYKLNLETMDLARNITGSRYLFEYIDFFECPEEVNGALGAIWTSLNCFREK